MYATGDLVLSVTPREARWTDDHLAETKTAAGGPAAVQKMRVRSRLWICQQVPSGLRVDGAIGVANLFAYGSLKNRVLPCNVLCVVLSQNAGIATSTLDNEAFVSKWSCGYALKGGVICVVVRFEKDYVR